MNEVVAVIFGWPAMLASVVTTLTGIANYRWRLALVGVAIGTPFLLYLALTPRFGFLATLVWLLYLASVYTLARGHQAVAVALVVPFIVLALFVASLVLRQYAG